MTNPLPSDFLKTLVKKLGNYGLTGAKYCGTASISPENSLGEINQEPIKEAMKTLMGQGVKFLIIILPSSNAATYSFIKYCADVLFGINTLCICPKAKPWGTQLDTSDPFIGNLALKINLKLRGVNHELMKPNQLLDDTIYFGVDVTHPTGTEGVRKAPSIAGVVANVDNRLGQWPASIRVQESRKEMVTNLEDMVLERLKAWKDTGKLPKRVLVYRDGVSESQYQAVLREELPAFQKAVGRFYANAKKPLPKISIVIVGKRHHTR